MQYVVIDVETTGGTPKNSKIIELSMFKVVDSQIVDEYTTLINPECEIPQFIERFTGITNAMVQNSPKFYEVAKDVNAFTEDCIFVAHNVGFDYGMYRREFLSLGFDYRRSHLCTVRSSRVVIPGHDSYSLGKLTKALGIGLHGRHRARGDAEATAHLFLLLEKTDKNQLSTFLQHEINPEILHPNLDLTSLEDLPAKSGIYKFYDETNRLLYIGKSKNIKKRVDQHLRNTKTKKGLELRAEIAKIEPKVTGNELVALLLESKLIKKHRPPYNTALKGTSFIYGVYDYTDQKGYLRFNIQKTQGNSARPIHRFSSKKDAVSFVEYMCEKYTLCQKMNGISKAVGACFNYQIKKCNGACTGVESVEIYNLRAQAFCDHFTFEHPNFFIIEDGRNKTEKCLILIKNGELQGWGYAPYYIMSRGVNDWLDVIENQESDRDATTILLSYTRGIREGKIKVI
jgi:DNA polymerase III subunit epsilon